MTHRLIEGLRAKGWAWDTTSGVLPSLVSPGWVQAHTRHNTQEDTTMKVFYRGERVQDVYVPLKMQGLAWALRAEDAWRATVRRVVQECTPEVFRQMRRLFEEEARYGQ